MCYPGKLFWYTACINYTALHQLPCLNNSSLDDLLCSAPSLQLCTKWTTLAKVKETQSFWLSAHKYPLFIPWVQGRASESTWGSFGCLWLKGPSFPEMMLAEQSQPWGCVDLDGFGLWGLSCLSTAQGAMEVTEQAPFSLPDCARKL